ncbi:hypothetical protein K227x_64580 [Rubripirellula lacrimiformis]|uniref:Uncharacterized protein n=1 Tax=Rubripirellula lacrimiformis TaxID=1930273 RepID=A0A517NLM4_9BACT|nr:hypothetical protein K227x_64580 [Rubripirellula lacrimiformis]
MTVFVDVDRRSPKWDPPKRNRPLHCVESDLPGQIQIAAIHRCSTTSTSDRTFTARSLRSRTGGQSIQPGNRYRRSSGVRRYRIRSVQPVRLGRLGTDRKYTGSSHGWPALVRNLSSRNASFLAAIRPRNAGLRTHGSVTAPPSRDFWASRFTVPVIQASPKSWRRRLAGRQNFSFTTRVSFLTTPIACVGRSVAIAIAGWGMRVWAPRLHGSSIDCVSAGSLGGDNFCTPAGIHRRPFSSNLL